MTACGPAPAAQCAARDIARCERLLIAACEQRCKIVNTFEHRLHANQIVPMGSELDSAAARI
jgi:hypothetical protein